MTLVSKLRANIRRGSLNMGRRMTVGFSKTVFENETFPSKFPNLKPALLYSNTQSLVGFSVIPKCVTLNDLEM